MKNDEQGRSMVEMLGVLAIVMVLSVAGVQMISKAFHSRKISVFIDQIATIKTNTHNVFLQRRKYDSLGSGITKCEDDSKSILPSEMCTSGEIRHVFGDTLTIEQDNEVIKGFVINVDIKDKDACMRLLTSDLGTRKIEINGQVYTKPLSVGEANQQCQQL